MNERPPASPVEAVVAETPPAAVPSVKPAAKSIQLLGGDEIIQLSLRPSPWCIALYSFKLVLAMVLLGAVLAITAQGRPAPWHSPVLLLLVLVAFSGVVAATLHWASQIYVLTNRRVLSFRGVFNVDAAECALPQIGEVRLRRAWYELVLRLGSIHITPSNPDKPAMIWEHVARPGEVQEILVRAIQKSKVGM